MTSIEQPQTIKIYQLIKMSGMYFCNTGLVTTNASMPSMGVGFYATLQEAEHNRTLEILKDTTSSGPKPTWHVFELEFPNPALV